MERAHYFCYPLIFLCIICATKVYSISLEEKAIYQAFLSGNMSAWKNIIDELENRSPKDKNMLLELLNYQYGYIGYCIGIKQKDVAETYLKLAFKNLNQLKQIEQTSQTMAYESMLLGFKISLNKIKAPTLGLQSMRLAREAITADPHNPIVLLCNGFIAFYSPPIVGGNKHKAIDYFKKSAFYYQVSGHTHDNWNYLNVLTILASSLEIMGKIREAESHYRLILKIAPEYRYVKEELYPNFVKTYKIDN